MSRLNEIDLSRLPKPAVFEQLDFEAIFKELVQDYKENWPEFTAELESEPVAAVLQTAAYRVMLERTRINEAAVAGMIAKARGSDLDHLGANYKVSRLIVEEEDLEATPPKVAVLEKDTDFRGRIHLALEGFSVAGPRGSYEFYARSASGQVKDVSVDSPEAGQARVVVLSREGNGTCTQDLLDQVTEALNEEEVRPLCDEVVVQAAEILEYDLKAQLTLYDGAGEELVRQAALKQATDYVEQVHKIGEPVTVSGLHHALTVEGVRKVDLISVPQGVAVNTIQAAYCTGVELKV